MTCNILDYGAKPDGTLCTKSIQAAIDTCFLQGGGEVVIPTGTFLTGGLRLRSNVTLHLLQNAILLGSTDPEDYVVFLDDTLEPISEEERSHPVDTVKKGETVGTSAYPYSRWNNAVIRGIRAENIAILGENGSEINGQNCFDAQGEEDYRGPHAINLWFCEHVTLTGYTVRDSANWAHAIQNSRNIKAERLTVLGGHDGFDIRTCDNISVENCRFQTGDDCIAGFDNIGVSIRNCTFESACSIFRFGGTDVLVENCQGHSAATYGFRGSLTEAEKRIRVVATPQNSRTNCLNAYLYYCDNRAEVRKEPKNILLKNCTFRQVDRIFSHPFGHKWCCNRPLSEISFENCSFQGIQKPCQWTFPENSAATVRFSDCTVSLHKDAKDKNPFSEGNLRLQIKNTKIT